MPHTLPRPFGSKSRVEILIGPPGAGKTKYVSDLRAREYDALGNPSASKFLVCAVSADDFFVNEDGEYKFDPALLGVAHASCMRKFSTYLAVGVTSTFDYVFVVDNTNTSLLEIAPYYALAKAYALPVRLVHFDAHPAACVHRNAHGVPEHVIWNMWKAARDLAPPPYWVVEESVVTDFQSYAQHQSEPID